MSVGIGRISKGLFQKAIEEVANNESNRPGLMAALKDPENPTAWFNFLEDSGALESATADYVRNRWCKFWPAYSAETVEAILRQSLIEALDLANDLYEKHKSFMPIDCHWIWTNDAETLEVLLTYNERQVTRMLLTPPPPTNPRLSLPGLAPYFIVKPRQSQPVSVGQEQELPMNPEPTQVGRYADPDPIERFRARPRDANARWVTTIQIKAQR
jgi:hypothetical protein